MRIPLLISATLAGTLLAACSGPKDSPAARDIRLATPSAAATPLVSKLEAGQSRLNAPPQQSAHRTAPATEPVQRQKAPVVAEVGLPHLVPAASQASPALVEAPDHMPMAAMPAAAPAEEPGSARVIDEAYHPSFTPRNTGIMIRGGMGGIDDKCDLRPHGGRGGIAINRSTPPLFRGGIR